MKNKVEKNVQSIMNISHSQSVDWRFLWLLWE